jgi:hypothetical protein
MGQYDDEINILGFRACFFIRSVVYRELRGFDDDFAHQESICAGGLLTKAIR